MRWKGRKQSTNIEDRRGGRSGYSGQRRPGGGMKIGGIGFFIALLIFLFTGQGQNFMDMMGGDAQMGGSVSQPPSQTGAASGATDEGKEFIGVVVKDTEDVWNPIFEKAGSRYREPTVVLFNDQVSSACGLTSSATGPFYCPGDMKVYLDLGFFRQLSQMGVRGDFAQAYVVAHEVGHHVQKLQGISDQVMRMQRQTNKTQANQLSVLLELQADCYAGIWARRQANYNLLDDGDLEEAMNAAGNIGDDRMQKRAGQYVNPDSFTHGSSAQRMEWLKRGMLSGDPTDCDTFAALR
ncbi:KPN_02809 family neutral zinc metallopeptidase [Leucothrix pacifica]|uniref:Flagellar biosynthesis protein FlgM n=1 Tax=Leucothrix pacifica TaxID=1247513 RepID=A0A317C8Q3_9GAMM|nr:neutral zinc metallopeptidase [Leucothrix pacifica]PWQ94974.1 flagellar biosynthesis protein FlgM [Leucothrix pacifica]